LLKAHVRRTGRHFRVQITARPSLVVPADGRGVVSHAGSRLLGDLADRTILTGELAEALRPVSRPRAEALTAV
jgi:hypothetical protein